MSQVLIAILLFILSLGAGSGVSAQTSASLRAQEIAAALDKTKYKKKEKRNVRIEIYIDVKNEAAVKNSVADYAGDYVCDEGNYNVELRISADGRIEGNGTDLYFGDSDFKNQKSRKFTFQNAKIEDALLTATKVYENGETKKFEAVFVNRTVLHGKNPDEIETRDIRYGLGFIETNGEFTNRVFLEFEN